jgi:hypothetical protein
MTRKKKGQLQEIFSKALYADNPELYSVSYRDFDSIIEVSLPEFLKISENFDLIPSNRIFVIKKEGVIIYHKFINASFWNIRIFKMKIKL